MFGNLSNFGPPSLPQPRAAASTKAIPPATPVHLPDCRPESVIPQSGNSESPESSNLPALLQSLVRPTEQVDITHLEALGVHVVADVSIVNLIPDASYIPDFDNWDTLSREEALVREATSRQMMCNGKQAPAAAKYIELRQGLSTDNDRAFRSVRRLTPKPGEPYVRLGYTHDFFRSLENLTNYWDDTSVQETEAVDGEEAKQSDDEQTGQSSTNEDHIFYRTSAGHTMPPHYRTQVVTSFLKLVTYDFSCTIAPHQEPRLYIKTQEPEYRHTFFASGCNFIQRIPTDRDSARRGIVEGPVAAVSARHTLSFPPVGGERESLIDLSREIIAALITAQYRTWEGKELQRIGKDTWWATRPRWGGGSGGPIGRETETQSSQDTATLSLGAAEEKITTSSDLVESNAASATDRSSSSRANFRPPSASALLHRPSSATSLPQPPNPKRPRRGLAIYDAYRMVRGPAMHWDPKTKYTTIGRQQGVDFDDIFVISCLFHHVSILRVRVPDKVSQVLSGSIPDPGLSARGRLEIRRTRWFDLYVAKDRIEAMKAVWAVMAYSMRKVVPVETAGEAQEGGNKADKASEADSTAQASQGTPKG